MGVVLNFSQAPTPLSSAGYKSGRNSCRGTPVSRSIERTNSPGTPFFERSSQYQTWDCVVPIRSARGFCPPTASHALRRASFDMSPLYPKLGEAQPKNLCMTTNRKLGSPEPMDGDSKGFGQRVRQRREELGLSQPELGRLAGYSQSNIDWIESGGPKRPKRAAGVLARPLMTTPEWLLGEGGQKHIGPEFLPTEELVKIYKSLTPQEKSEISRGINKYRVIPRKPHKKTG